MMAKKRGSGYSGPDSTRPTQQQESDKSNLGGTAPGGTVAFMGAASQWATSKAADRANFPNLDPVGAAHMKHYGASDGPPDISRNVPIHPGLQPGLFRTPRLHNAPRGMENDPTANDGRPISPDGKHRGESPEVPKQSRGSYRP